MLKYLLLLSIILLPICIAADDPLSFVVMVNFDGEKFTPESLELAAGESPDLKNQPEEGYTAKVKSFKDEELYSFKFSASLHAYDLQQEFEEMPVQLIFPHFVNA
ncbi:MAG: hypothetical protein ABIB71_05095, partial [Candidatus Woesearchaeota archaeon]